VCDMQGIGLIPASSLTADGRPRKVTFAAESVAKTASPRAQWRNSYSCSSTGANLHRSSEPMRARLRQASDSQLGAPGLHADRADKSDVVADGVIAEAIDG
jgi:hypothetical protein